MLTGLGRRAEGERLDAFFAMLAESDDAMASVIVVAETLPASVWHGVAIMLCREHGGVVGKESRGKGSLGMSGEDGWDRDS